MKKTADCTATDIERESRLKQTIDETLRKIFEDPIEHGEFQLRIQFRDGKLQRYVTIIEESHM